ncbi:TPA: hypothetical protein QDB14_004511 [Burkholderia vietnamiensis]|nr:hypothetical protein [Burkholderia vietnamiensis]
MKTMKLEVDAIEDELSAPVLEVAAVKEILSNPAAEWFNLGRRGRLYLRRSTLTLENEEREGLVIANVSVQGEYRRTGVFSNAVAVIEEAAARMALRFVFVEVVTNPVLIPALEKRSYTIRRTKHDPIELGEIVLPAPPDRIDAYKLISEARSK